MALIRIIGWLSGLIANEKLKKLYELQSSVTDSFFKKRKTEIRCRIAKEGYLSPVLKDLVGP
jgi:hypothetical protein